MRTLLRVFTQQPLAAKVPEVTALFWVIKISTTAAGEAISDMFVNNKKVGVVVELSMFVVALVLQFAVRRYSAIPYWFLALAIATAGTGVADTMHLVLDMPYAVTTALLGRGARPRSSSCGIAASTRSTSTPSPPAAGRSSTGASSSPPSPSVPRSATSPPPAWASGT